MFGTEDLVAQAPTVPKSGTLAEGPTPPIPTKNPRQGWKRKAD